MQQLDIELKVRLPFRLIKRKNWYVAQCAALDVASQGETAEKAKKNLSEALSAFLITCIEHGTLDAVLKDCGFKSVQSPIPRKKRINVPATDYISIPLQLLTSQPCQDRCRA